MTNVNVKNLGNQFKSTFNYGVQKEVSFLTLDVVVTAVGAKIWLKTVLAQTNALTVVSGDYCFGTNCLN